MWVMVYCFDFGDVWCLFDVGVGSGYYVLVMVLVNDGLFVIVVDYFVVGDLLWVSIEW